MKIPTNGEELLEYIEKYTTGEMDQTESAFFERELETNDSFRQEFNSYKITYQYMQETFIEKSAIRTMNALRRQRELKKITFRTITTTLAACLLIVGYLSFVPISFPDSENDFDAIRSTIDSTSSQLPPDQKEAFEQFFEGQAHIAEGKYLLAVTNFEKVLKTQNLRNYFIEAAQWHLIVALAKSNNPARAEKLLNTLNDCTECEYQIGFTNRMKIKWLIFSKKYFD